MQLECVHCRGQFIVSTEQLGQQGRCPHCNGEIRFLGAESETQAARSENKGSHFWENSISGLTSMVVHMVLFIIMALINIKGGGSGEGLGDEVLIGELPSVTLSAGQDEQLGTEAPSATHSDMAEILEIQAPVQPTTLSTTNPLDQYAVVSPSTGGGDTNTFDLGAVSIGGGSMAGGSWGGVLQSLRRNGLDIVITFDSTGSMGGEIRAVKRQIHRIGTTLLTLVPKSRISICTYRDVGDEYTVKGMPLSNDIAAIDRYLQSIEADAGGDEPEAVHLGLEWAVQKNEFRPQARKVILLFGDAPPRSQDLGTCLRIASEFNRQQKGVVSSVTCRRSSPLPEFAQISKAGGGEAFLSSNEREIMTQLLVLVFGSAHREKVVEAFKLMDR